MFGGVFDPEFEAGSKRLFKLVQSGELVALVSDLTVSELALAPPAVQSVLTALPIGSADFVTGNEEVVNLTEEGPLAEWVARIKNANERTSLGAKRG